MVQHQGHLREKTILLRRVTVENLAMLTNLEIGTISPTEWHENESIRKAVRELAFDARITWQQTVCNLRVSQGDIVVAPTTLSVVTVPFENNLSFTATLLAISQVSADPYLITLPPWIKSFVVEFGTVLG
jgi:hypothetical protein